MTRASIARRLPPAARAARFEAVPCARCGKPRWTHYNHAGHPFTTITERASATKKKAL